jgi:glycosyltransferase involved in cell wall biosynthesis
MAGICNDNFLFSKRAMTRVLHVLDGFGMGGAETWLLGQLRYLERHPEIELQMSFLLTGTEPGFLYSEFEKFSHGIHQIRISKNLKLREVKDMRHILKSGGFDAIHFHQDYTSGLIQALLVGRLPAVVVAHFHNPKYQQDFIYDVSLRRSIMLKLGKLFCAQFSTHFIGTSWKILDTYDTKKPLFSKIHKEAIYCFFDLSRFSDIDQTKRPGSNSNHYNVLFIGRLDSSTDFDNPGNHKNSALALSIIKELIDQGLKVKFDMVGKSDHALKKHERLISQLSLEGQVQIHGIKKEIEPFLEKANLLLFPSREEGMGMVAIEAQAAGLPVLKSDGVPDEVICIQKSVNSISLHATIEEWAKAARELLELASPTSRVDRRQFEKFDIEVQFPKLIDIYNGK